MVSGEQVVSGLTFVGESEVIIDAPVRGWERSRVEVDPESGDVGLEVDDGEGGPAGVVEDEGSGPVVSAIPVEEGDGGHLVRQDVEDDGDEDREEEHR